jgi:Fur family transcriptional regulator, ferric uptake regulator
MSAATGVDLHTVIGQRLRGAGQRYTSGRRQLVTVLERARKPLPIGEIVRASGDLPQSSIYRNLAVLEQTGIVRRVITEEEFGRYELTEEFTEHHHHLICSSCGKVEDVTIPGPLESTMDKTMDKVARRAGFAEVSHRLDLIGICRDCA